MAAPGPGEAVRSASWPHDGGLEIGPAGADAGITAFAGQRYLLASVRLPVRLKTGHEQRRARPARTDEPALPPPRPRRTARFVFAFGLVLLGLWIARGFLLAIAWGIVIALALWPLYERFAQLLPQRGRNVLAPLLFTLATGLILLVPLVFAALQVAQEAQGAIEWLVQLQENGIPPPSWLMQIPVVGGRMVAWWRAHLSDPRAVGDLFGQVDTNMLAGWTQALGAQLLQRLVQFVFTVLTLFFLFRDGEVLGRRFLALADRWLGDPGERLAEDLASVVRSTVNGTVLVALGEGTLIGIAYSMTGVPHPLLFGGLTIAFAMLPFGAWFAFTAAALVLLVQGAGVLVAGGLFAFGAAVMFVGDNFVQPALIGGAARLPFLAALIGILGGVGTFGLIGLFLGPAIMAALLAVWREWIDPPVPVVPR